jgi:hypothetical protein
MLKAVVTIGTAVAVAVALALVVGLRDQRHTPSPLSGDEPFGERVRVTLGRTSSMVAGAGLAGMLTMGAGLRLMMRVLAVTSSGAAQGARTEADEIVGEVSAGGSVFLVVVIGAGAGLVGLALFAPLRRWLPDRSVGAGLVGAAIGAGLLARPTNVLSSNNRDFELLGPVALAVVVCVALFALFGATFGVLVDRFAARWPRPGRSVARAASMLPIGILVLVPPVFAAVVLAVAIGVAAPKIRPSSAPALTAAHRGVGRAVVLAAGGLGALSVGLSAAQILT